MGNPTYAGAIASALRIELGSTHQSIKTLMKWTQANEKTAKNWLAGTHGPSGHHLMALILHSDGVFAAVMTLTNRHGALATDELHQLRTRLRMTVVVLDAYLDSGGSAVD
jgi:hypothetical protein